MAKIKRVQILWLTCKRKRSKHIKRKTINDKNEGTTPVLIGPNICAFCYMDGESIDHLFLKSPYLFNMWSYAIYITRKTFHWHGAYIQDAFHTRLNNPSYTHYRALHVLVI